MFILLIFIYCTNLKYGTGIFKKKGGHFQLSKLHSSRATAPPFECHTLKVTGLQKHCGGGACNDPSVRTPLRIKGLVPQARAEQKRAGRPGSKVKCKDQGGEQHGHDLHQITLVLS